MTDEMIIKIAVASCLLGLALFASLRSLAPDDQRGSRLFMTFVASVLGSLGIFYVLGVLA